MAEDEWKYKSEDVTSFKTPTMQHDTLWHDYIMQEGYRPKMLLYTLDKLFYIYDQVKHHRGIDEKFIVAYEILSFAVLCCTGHRGWVEKSRMPDAMLLVNLNDTRHLKCLTWAVYNGALLVGNHPELPGECQWCTVLAGIFQHIYKGHNETAHCAPYTLASWDCQQRTEVVCEERRQNATHCRHDGGCRARGQRLRSGSRHHSKTPSQKGWTRYTCSSPPNTLPLRYPGAGELFFPSSYATPKLSLAVSILAYARSSCSAGDVAQALLDDDKDEEQDFQTPHTPVYHMVRWEEGGQGEPAAEWMEASGGSLAWWFMAHVDIGKEELEKLAEIDASWRAKWWLEVAAQGIRDKEVPRHNLLVLLTSGAEGTTKALAKLQVAAWRWNIKV